MLGQLCKAFNKSPQAYYGIKKAKIRENIKAQVATHMAQSIRKTHPGYGLRKLHYTLKGQGISIGRDKLRGLLKEKGLLFKPKLCYRVKTTNSNHHYRLHPNLLPKTTIYQPEQVWVADITAIRINSQACYLALVADAYSRRIMGWHIATQNTGSLACQALSNAQQNRIYPANHIIHHSDRGIQYCCTEYRILLHKLKMQISTTETGDPRENAIIERTIRTLKYEYGLRHNFSAYETACKAIEYAIDRYNNLRIHYSCNLKTPTQKHLPPFFINLF